MSLLAFAPFQKKGPMRQPGQKAVTGRVASHTPLQVSTQTAGLHALDFPSMTGCESRRGDGGALFIRSEAPLSVLLSLSKGGHLPREGGDAALRQAQEAERGASLQWSGADAARPPHEGSPQTQSSNFPIIFITLSLF